MSRPPLTPTAIEWNRKHADQWARRAAELRASSDQADRTRAMALASVVASLRARLPAALAPEPTVEAGDVQQLEARLVACEPALYPGTSIMMGVGPIMDGVRQRLRERIAALRGEPALEVTTAPATIGLPPAEALPFVAGPQLDLFGIAA